MRLWPFRRAPRIGYPATEDLLVTEDLLRRNVEDVLAVRERQIRGGIIVFRGELRMAPGRALDLLVARFREFGYTPFVRADRDGVAIQAWPLAETVERQRVGLNVILFLLTCASTLAAGWFFTGSPAFDALRASTSPTRFLAGAPFAVTLMAILGVHEFGHYFTARYYKASVSLPYFIPAPPPFLFGTLGAIIRMRSPARDRNSLFDIAAAGPLAGLLIALPAIFLGLEWSTVAPIPPGETIVFGNSILMRALVHLRFGPIPEGLMVFTHPIADAAWAGFFVTALNLFPVGQLDGGRIAYALFGQRHRTVGVVTFVALLLLGAVTGSMNWVVWAGLLFFMVGFHHSPPLDDLTPLSSGRRMLGLLCLILLILLIPPVPVQMG
ncbi:MAG: site-2 protease family protein [Candidatus Rokubacteria bacterium]|nr:site-2 protease family protein [Candidatus Rokubacteria bacterium]